jgi:hypothetical protein
MTAEILAATTEGAAPESDDKGIVEPPSAESAPAVADADESSNRKAKEGYSERIDELTRYRREAERERDYWRNLALDSQNKRQPEQREASRETHETPYDQDVKTLADFQYDERAYSKYIRNIADQAAKREAENLRKEFRESRTQEDKAAALIGFQERAQTWAKEQKIEDADLMFAPPRDGGPVITDSMAETIMDSERGHEVLHYLAKNRSLSAQIARMSPLQQAREIGRLEAKLSSGPQPNKVSGAPPPAPRIDGSGVGGGNVKADSADSDKLSDAEWMRLREKQLEGRRNAALRNRS